MSTHRHVLIPLDDSDASWRAVEAVAAAAKDGGADEVTLLHVAGPVPPRLLESGGASTKEEEDAQHEELEEARRRWLDEQRLSLRPQMRRAETRLVEAGVPGTAIHREVVSMIPEDEVADRILERCRRDGCSRIVVGRESHGWFYELTQRHVAEELKDKTGEDVAVSVAD